MNDHQKRKFYNPPKAAQPLDDLAAEAIRELSERGEWETLPGKGQPLRLVGDLTDKATLSAKLRSDAGFSTTWNDLAREIDEGLREAQTHITRAHKFRAAALRDAKARDPKANAAQSEANWSAALSSFEKQIAALNSLILKYNLLIPSQMPQLHRPRLRAERVLADLNLVAPENNDE